MLSGFNSHPLSLVFNEVSVWEISDRKYVDRSEYGRGPVRIEEGQFRNCADVIEEREREESVQQTKNGNARDDR